MNPGLQFLLGLCALVVTIVQIMFKSGMWAGRHEASRGDIERLEREITRLREWRHKLGEDPCDALGLLCDLHDKRIERLERRVFNGHK